MKENKLLFDLGLEDPEMKVFYDDANQRIEKWSKFVYFITVIIIPIGYYTPRLIISIAFYFTTRMDSDAFELSFPFW